MSKLVLTIDTEASTFEVTLDGETIPKVGSVNAYMDMYSYDGESPKPHFELCVQDRKGDHAIMTRIVAADVARREGREGTPSRRVPGHVEVPGLTEAQRAVAGFLGGVWGPESP